MTHEGQSQWDVTMGVGWKLMSKSLYSSARRANPRNCKAGVQCFHCIYSVSAFLHYAKLLRSASPHENKSIMHNMLPIGLFGCISHGMHVIKKIWWAFRIRHTLLLYVVSTPLNFKRFSMCLEGEMLGLSTTRMVLLRYQHEFSLSMLSFSNLIALTLDYPSRWR